MSAKSRSQVVWCVHTRHTTIADDGCGTPTSMRKHVVFVVDASRSMARRDVREGGTPKRRIDAVLDCCFEFIEDQLANPYSSRSDRYSVISFNDVAKVQLRGKPMHGRDLYALRRDLEGKIRPTHGTAYGQGLASAWDVASGGVDDAGEQFVLIFLSDGRPVDMNVGCKRVQPPAHWLRFMREQFRRRLTFHGVGVGPEDFCLLEEMCGLAEGTFHHARLGPSGGKRNQSCRAPRMSGRPDTLSSTFSNISSSVSSQCSSHSARVPKPFALEDVEEADWNTTDQDTYYCDKLYLEGGTLVVQQRDLLVRVRERPFAVGGMRHCFRVWNLGVGGRSRNVLNLVGKQSKFFVSRSEQLRGLKQELCCHRLAQQQAEAFNSRIESFAGGPVANNTSYSALRRNPSGLEVAECDVYRLEDPSEPGGFRYLLVEPFLEGRYLKYNGNNGYILDKSGLDDEQRCWWMVAQAFSHFTHHQSRGSLLVCDVQGVDFMITDPCVHSKQKMYGAGDRGSQGMRDFLEGHRCNAICRHLGLPQPATTATSSTTAASRYAPVHGNLATPLRRTMPPVAPAFCGVVIAEEEYDSDDYSCDGQERSF
ncbi:unnamed protein product [Pylaiella littoralis]